MINLFSSFEPWIWEPLCYSFWFYGYMKKQKKVQLDTYWSQQHACDCLKIWTDYIRKLKFGVGSDSDKVELWQKVQGFSESCPGTDLVIMAGMFLFHLCSQKFARTIFFFFLHQVFCLFICLLVFHKFLSLCLRKQKCWMILGVNFWQRNSEMNKFNKNLTPC